MADTPDIYVPLRLKLAQDTLVSCFEPSLARNDACLICLDAWDSGPELHHQLIVHASCRQFYHESCFSTWYSNCYEQNIPPRCPLCADPIPIPDVYFWRSLRQQARSLQIDLQFQEKRLLWLFEDMYHDLMELISQAKPVSLAGIRPADLAVSLHVISTSLHNLVRVRMHSQYARILRLVATNLFRTSQQSIGENDSTNPAIRINSFTRAETHLSRQFTKFTTSMLNTLSAGSTRNQNITNALFQWRDTCLQQERSYNYGAQINRDTALILANRFHTFARTQIRTELNHLSTSLMTSINELMTQFSDSTLFATDETMEFYYPTFFDEYLQHMATLKTTFTAEAEQDKVDDEAFRRDVDGMLWDIGEFRRTGRITPIRRRMVNRRLGAIMREWGGW